MTSEKTPTATDAAARAWLEAHLHRPPFHDFLQPEIVGVQSGLLRLRFPYRPEFRRRTEAPAIHGGVLAACIDAAGHAALASMLGRPVPTIDMRIDYLRPAIGTDLHALARVVRAGASVGVVDVELAGDDGRQLVLGRCLFSTATR